MHGDTEFAETAGVVADEPLTFAFVQVGLVGFLIGRVG